MSRSKARRRTRGQTLAEFALVFPILLVMLMGVFDFGRAIFLYNSLTNAAREGARLAIVNQDETRIGQRVQDMAFTGSVTNLGDPNLVNFYKQNPPDTDPTTHAICDPTAVPSTMAVGCVAVVDVHADWSAITPIIGSIIGPIDFNAQSVVQVEFVCPNPNILAYVDPANCPKQP
jgi:Flp pilus assembly protein TadG